MLLCFPIRRKTFVLYVKNKLGRRSTFIFCIHPSEPLRSRTNEAVIDERGDSPRPPLLFRDLLFLFSALQLLNPSLQELLRQRPGFSPRVLESSLHAIGGGTGPAKTPGVGGAAGSDFPGGIDPGAAGDGAGGGASGSAGGSTKVAATERTKTVLACLFEALGSRRATREVARVLCAISAGTAAAAAAAAVASAAAASEAAATAAAAAGEGGGWGRQEAALLVPPAVVVPVLTAAAAVPPRVLLPVLASLPERCADIVGLALEVLETGQAAADALARDEGRGAGGHGAVFRSVDAAGR